MFVCLPKWIANLMKRIRFKQIENETEVSTGIAFFFVNNNNKWSIYMTSLLMVSAVTKNGRNKSTTQIIVFNIGTRLKIGRKTVHLTDICFIGPGGLKDKDDVEGF